MARQAHGGRPLHSQQWWTEGEALERAGRLKEAVGLYAKAAMAEEDAGHPLRARILWEQVAEKAGATGTVLERLAMASGRAQLRDEAFDYWAAAAARYHGEGRADDADRAKAHAAALKAKVGAHDRPKLAEAALAGPSGRFVADLL